MDQMPGQLRLSLDSCETIHTTGHPPVVHDTSDDDQDVESLLEARLRRSLPRSMRRPML
jgi:hypothetical protein